MIILEKKIAGLSTASLARFVLRARRAVGLRGKVNVLVTGNVAMRSLNRHFRKKNEATDVLSFPAEDAKVRASEPFAGEIAISADIARQNAARLGHTAAAEVEVLVLHGILHLAGYDHERDNGTMQRKEAKLRQALKLPSSLIERAQSGRSARASGRKTPPRGARNSA